MSFKFKNKPYFFVRNIEAGDLLENFLIAAVSSLLAIRAFLKLTDYPQLGGGKFHIAHILWGGFLMTIALVILLVFLNKEAKRTASIVGGIGFGAFIDELGKFITSDNDYFFQPTIALIYVIFVLLFLSTRALEKYLKFSDREYTINALEVTKEVILHDLDKQEKEQALRFLEQSDPDTPAVSVLKTTLSKIDAISVQKPSLFSKLRKTIYNFYQKLINTTWFEKAIIIFFVTISTINLLHAIFDILLSLTLADLNPLLSLSFTKWGQLISSIISGTLVLAGVYFIRRSRLEAYEMFKKSILISIFLTQFFLFYQDQLRALAGLAISILILLTLQHLINQEKIFGKHPNINLKN
jgi:hypothetical protein